MAAHSTMFLDLRDGSPLDVRTSANSVVGPHLITASGEERFLIFCSWNEMQEYGEEIVRLALAGKAAAITNDHPSLYCDGSDYPQVPA